MSNNMLFWFSAVKKKENEELASMAHEKNPHYKPKYFKGIEYTHITDTGEKSNYCDADLIGAGQYHEITNGGAL
jgi:hypothetical protein